MNSSDQAGKVYAFVTSCCFVEQRMIRYTYSSYLKEIMKKGNGSDRLSCYETETLYKKSSCSRIWKSQL